MSVNKIIKKQFGEIGIKINPPRSHEPSGKLVNVSRANIVLFFNCNSANEIKSINFFLDKISNNFSIGNVLVYLDSNEVTEVESHDIIKIITNSDFNIFSKIKRNTNDWLSDNTFDILISFADNSDLFCNKIINNITADFKAGSFDKQNLDLFDLTLVNTDNDYNKKFENYIHYINNLNINV